MPRSVPVSELMVPRNQWPQLRAKAQIKDAIRILRILSEDKKLVHGHSTPLVLDDDYNLLGFIRLIDLLRSVRHLCEPDGKECDLGKAIEPISDIVIPFEDKLAPDDSILHALDLMANHGVSILPVIDNKRLQGVVQLADIFQTVAILLFDPDKSAERSWISQYLHL